MVVGGFLSCEVREGGVRVGFTVEEIGGPWALMAHVDWVKGPRVGRYGVDVSAFERVALPAVERAVAMGGVVVIDEIGSMQLLSGAFVAELDRLFAAEVSLVATVHERGHPVSDAVKTRPGVEVVMVTLENRDGLPEVLSRVALDRDGHPL